MEIAFPKKSSLGGCIGNAYGTRKCEFEIEVSMWGGAGVGAFDFGIGDNFGYGEGFGEREVYLREVILNRRHMGLE
jgi:hypothetical protein